MLFFCLKKVSFYHRSGSRRCLLILYLKSTCLDPIKILRRRKNLSIYYVIVIYGRFEMAKKKLICMVCKKEITDKEFVAVKGGVAHLKCSGEIKSRKDVIRSILS